MPRANRFEFLNIRIRLGMGFSGRGGVVVFWSKHWTYSTKSESNFKQLSKFELCATNSFQKYVAKIVLPCNFRDSVLCKSNTQIYQPKRWHYLAHWYRRTGASICCSRLDCMAVQRMAFSGWNLARCLSAGDEWCWMCL